MLRAPEGNVMKTVSFLFLAPWQVRQEDMSDVWAGHERNGSQQCCQRHTKDFEEMPLAWSRWPRTARPGTNYAVEQVSMPAA